MRGGGGRSGHCVVAAARVARQAEHVHHQRDDTPHSTASIIRPVTDDHGPAASEARAHAN